MTDGLLLKGERDGSFFWRSTRGFTQRQPTRWLGVTVMQQRYRTVNGLQFTG
jgi:hypothetical protein